MENSVKQIDMTKFNDFIKQINDEKFVKVGILGNKNNRSKGTNASIGAIMEFGSISKKISVRSFLRMPLHQKSKEILEMVKKTSKGLIEKGNHTQIFVNLGLACESIIQQAFTTSGFGKWAPLKYRDGKPLIDTGQLRRSITSKVGNR